MAPVLSKVLRAAGIVLVAVVVAATVTIATLLALAAHRSARYYDENVANAAAGTTAARYAAMGPHETTCLDIDAHGKAPGAYHVWLPTDAGDEGQLPVVLWANGTGSTASTYTPFLRHLTSWGFVVVGSDDENTRTGESLNDAIDMLAAENGREGGPLHGRGDLERVGVGGHSQGGAGAINMATRQPHADMVRAVYAASMTSLPLAQGLGSEWEYDMGLLRAPVFLVAGTGAWDGGNVGTKEEALSGGDGVVPGICPLWSMRENYEAVPDYVDRSMARRVDSDHGDSYTRCDPYMTAWFAYCLRDDAAAGKAILGPDGELAHDGAYSDVAASRAREG